jgi:hypothetical protein
MNTLKKIWSENLRLHIDLDLTFKKEELVDYKVTPNLKHYTPEVVNGIVSDLIEKKMITFFDDVPKMLVSVPIQDIGQSGEKGGDDFLMFIETFHHDLSNEHNDLFDRDCDVPIPLHKFMEIENEILVTDF